MFNTNAFRRSVLNRAVQGKLTQQLSSDGNAVDLLQSIDEEKQRLIKTGRIKNQKNLVEITDDETSFTIPDNWKWVRLNDLVNINSGLSYKKENLSDDISDIRIIRGGNISNHYKLLLNNDDYRISDRFISNSKVFLKANQLIMPVSTSPKHTAKVAIVPHLNSKVVAGGFIYQITPLMYNKIFSKFLTYSLSSPNINGKIKSLTRSSGSALNNLPKTKLKKIVIPVPPLHEQKRIVKKVDKCFKWADLIDQEQKLTQDFEDDMYKSLLQSAMQGQLTQQLPEDGYAADLLQSIAEEKQHLYKAGKIKKPKQLNAITDDEIPFKIPDSWKWVRLNDISSYIQRGKSPQYGTNGIKVLAQKCINWNGIDLSKAKRIDKDSLPKYNQIRYLKNNDILWNSTGRGTLGRATIANKDSINLNDILVVDSHITIIRTLLAKSKFILYYILSPIIQNNLNNISSGSTNQIELSKRSVEKLIVPLPPLTEQKRIVNELDSLLSKIDKI